MTPPLARLALPTGIERWAVAMGCVAWAGALAGTVGGLLGATIVASAMGATVWWRRWVLVAVLAGAAVSGVLAQARMEATLAADLPSGPVTVRGVVADEPHREPDGFVLLFAASCTVRDGNCDGVALPPLALSLGEEIPVEVGDRLEVAGTLRAAPGKTRGDAVAGKLTSTRVTNLGRSPNPLLNVGNGLRRRVTSELEGRRPASAANLMAGLLIGDTSAMTPSDLDALRRSGLTHYVAVSGSNVALFLAGWWLLTAPLSLGTRSRSVLGLAGLAVFVVVTRWEASVVRASTMASLVLLGQIGSIPISAWTALGTATTLLLLVSGDLATNVGFQLSVAATAGVLVGAAMFSDRRPRLVWSVLGATAAAQTAVTPLLLFHFGSVPLLSPIANLLAAPMVTFATALGGVGTLLGLDVLVQLGLYASQGVLEVAQVAATWPQVGTGSVLLVGAAAWATRRPVLRPVVLAFAGVFALSVCAPYRAPPVPTVTVLDVGQGDAVLLEEPGAAVMLVDGGRDPALLQEKLRERGLRSLDLLAVTHGDADHLGGLIGLADHIDIGQVWVPDQPSREGAMADFVGSMRSRGVTVEHVGGPVQIRLGRFSVEVLGPRRRYQGENDGSIVMRVTANGRTMLLAGDAEAVAQRDLDVGEVDALLVPHHGSATSDLAWLLALRPAVAVVSVGENRFGHPSAAVVEGLVSSGASVHITRQVGDIAVRFP